MERRMAAAMALALAISFHACGGAATPRPTASPPTSPAPSVAPLATSTRPPDDLLPPGVDEVVRAFVAKDRGEYVGRCSEWEDRHPPVERAFCHLRVDRLGPTLLRFDVGIVASDYVFRLTVEQLESGQWVLRSVQKLGGI